MGNLFSVSSTVGPNSVTATNILRRINDVSKKFTSIDDIHHTKNATIAAGVIPMDELIAMNADYRDSHNKAQTILGSLSGITSVISSSILIWMIMRSHERLSTTQHRLLLGLCISDVLFSLSFSTFNAMAPSDNAYFTWNARGNEATCDAQGFFLMSGGGGGLFYNASLNLYFLAVVKYKKSNEFIRTKIEPFLHGVPIAVTLGYSIAALVKKHYNSSGGGCNWIVNDALHCIGYDVGEIREDFEIPCWRGSEGAMTTFISSTVLMIIPAVIIIVSLGIIYRAVRTQEKKLAAYGIGSLRANLQQYTSTPQQDTLQESTSIWGRMSSSLTSFTTRLKSGLCLVGACKKTKTPPTTRSNDTHSKSRAVMHKAFGYTFAWFLSWGVYLIGLTIDATTDRMPIAVQYIMNVFLPLQGLFNLLIFMHPKIIAAKNSKRGGETVSWCKAFFTAFWSRGKGGTKQATSKSSLRHGNRRPNKVKNEDTPVAPTIGRMKTRNNKRANAPQEEEKCEIQAPY